MDIAVYYGGTCCDCVMIPASLNRSGWCVFQKELDKFLFGENTVLVAERTSEGISGGGLMAGGGLIGDDPRNKVGSISPGQLEGTDKGSHPAVMSPKNTSISGNPIHCHQWKVSNQFSPLGNLGREGDPWSEEVEEVFTEVPSISDKEGCDSQIGMTASEAAYADGMQNCESELLFLPWGQSGADTKNSGNGENNSSPLECVSLS